MSRHYTKKDHKIQIEFRPGARATAHGGQVEMNALAQEFGLWEKVRREPGLDLRRHFNNLRDIPDSQNKKERFYSS